METLQKFATLAKENEGKTNEEITASTNWQNRFKLFSKEFVDRVKKINPNIGSER